MTPSSHLAKNARRSSREVFSFSNPLQFGTLTTFLEVEWRRLGYRTEEQLPGPGRRPPLLLAVRSGHQEVVACYLKREQTIARSRVGELTHHSDFCCFYKMVETLSESSDFYEFTKSCPRDSFLRISLILSSGIKEI